MMTKEEAITWQDQRALQTHGLTHAQMTDCYRAGRNPKTGKRYRTSPPSSLEVKNRKVNWAKLQVKGASIGMIQAVDQMEIRASERDELVKTIRKLEVLLLNKLTEGYEVTRFEYWQESASKKKFSC